MTTEKLYFKTFGVGDPILILHGLFGTADNWNTIGKKLAENFTVFLIDLRNHGQSFHHDQMDYKVMVEDLLVWMEDQWIYKAGIIGHSMGGKLAMEFACLYPDKVDSLMVVDIMPFKHRGGHEEILDALLSINLDNIERRESVADYLKEQGFDEATLLFLLKNLQFDMNLKKYRWKIHLKALNDNYYHLMDAVASNGKYEGETIFLKGAKSNYIELDKWSEIIEKFPKATLKEIEAAGHWVHADNPLATTKAIIDFFSKTV